MPVELQPFTPQTVSPDTTPIGPMAVALAALRQLVANVPWFQQWTGSGSAAAALGRVFVGEVGWPVTALAIAAGVATVTTREPHTLQVGDTVTLQGASLGAQGLAIADGAGVVVISVDTSSFTAAVDADDQEISLADAGAYVLPAARPFAVVSEPDDGGVKSNVIGSGGTAVYAGALEILIEDNVSAQYVNDPRNALTEARNKLGSFLQGLVETQGNEDLMVLNDAEVTVAPAGVPMDESDDVTKRFTRWQALLRVTWGVSG